MRGILATILATARPIRGAAAACVASLVLVALLASSAPAARVPRSAIPLPPVRQATEYTCGPASLLSVLAYFGKGGVGEKQLARQARTNWVSGTEERDLARVARLHGLAVEMKYGMSLGELRARVRGGHPVIVGLQAWPDNPRTFRPEGDGAGHYAVVIGFDRRRIWFMDPYAPLGTRGWLALPDFLRRWHWPDSRGIDRPHFGMVLRTSSRERVRAWVDGATEVQ